MKPFGQQIAGVKEVPRLCFIFASDEQERAVQPVFHEGLAGRTFALGDFIPRGAGISSPRRRGADQSSARALSCSWRNTHVPARAAFAPRTVPGHIAVVGGRKLSRAQVGDGFFSYSSEATRSPVRISSKFNFTSWP